MLPQANNFSLIRHTGHYGPALGAGPIPAIIPSTQPVLSGKAPGFYHSPGNGTVMQVSDDLKSLLDLPDHFVRLGASPSARARRDFSAGSPAKATPDPAPEGYNHNIPEADRHYIHESNRQLLDRYVLAFMQFDSDTPRADAVLPFDRLKSDLLTALELTPARAEDASVLRRACWRLNRFLPEHQMALKEALRTRPDLRPYIESSAAKILEAAVDSAMANKSVWSDLQDADQLIALAKTSHENILMQESYRFYADPHSIGGTRWLGPSSEIESLAKGVVIYNDLDSLLRYGPVGKLTYEFVRVKMYNHVTRLAYTSNRLETRGVYEGGITDLLYRNPAGGQTAPIRVIMAEDGYSIGKSSPILYPQTVPHSVRQMHAARLKELIGRANEMVNRGNPGPEKSSPA